MKQFIAFLSFIAVALAKRFEAYNNMESTSAIIHNNMSNMTTSTSFALSFVTFLNLELIKSKMQNLYTVQEQFTKLCNHSEMLRDSNSHDLYVYLTCQDFVRNSKTEFANYSIAKTQFYESIGYNENMDNSTHRIYQDDVIPDSFLQKQIDLISRRQFLPEEPFTKNPPITYVTEYKKVNDTLFDVGSIESQLKIFDDIYTNDKERGIQLYIRLLTKIHLTYRDSFKILTQEVYSFKNSFVEDEASKLELLRQELNRNREYLAKEVESFFFVSNRLQEDKIKNLLESSSSVLYFSNGKLVHSITISPAISNVDELDKNSVNVVKILPAISDSDKLNNDSEMTNNDNDEINSAKLYEKEKKYDDRDDDFSSATSIFSRYCSILLVIVIATFVSWSL